MYIKLTIQDYIYYLSEVHLKRKSRGMFGLLDSNLNLKGIPPIDLDAPELSSYFEDYNLILGPKNGTHLIFDLENGGLALLQNYLISQKENSWVHKIHKDEDISVIPEVLVFRYTNYKKEAGMRKVHPRKIYFGSTEYHPTKQWLMKAWDYNKEDFRIFAMNDMRLNIKP